MEGSYNLLLVFASYCVAVIAAYTAIYFGTKVFELSGGSRKFWMAAGAMCLGSGIWSMHFVGMSAYNMPMDMEMSFNAWITALSWVPAVLASALALYVITLPKASAKSIAASAFIMGAGIFCMHYTGMYAMKMDPPIQYDTLLVIISGVIAVVASGAALVICRKVREVPERYVLIVKIVAALVMGVAICGMHYTGMAAASYPMDASMAHSNSLRGDWMGIPTAVAASIFLLIAVYVAYSDFREIERQKQAYREKVEAAKRTALYDPVSGLPNRASLETKVLEKMRVSEQGGSPKPFTLLYFELNDYRHYTQSEGEAFSQALIQRFTEQLKTHLNQAEVITRSRSNGFTAICPSLSKAQLQDTLNPLIKALAMHTSIKGKELQIAWSFGLSEFPKSGTNSRNLIRQSQQIRNEFNVSSSAKVSNM